MRLPFFFFSCLCFIQSAQGETPLDIKTEIERLKRSQNEQIIVNTSPGEKIWPTSVVFTGKIEELKNPIKIEFVLEASHYSVNSIKIDWGGKIATYDLSEINDVYNVDVSAVHFYNHSFDVENGGSAIMISIGVPYGDPANVCLSKETGQPLIEDTRPILSLMLQPNGKYSWTRYVLQEDCTYEDPEDRFKN